MNPREQRIASRIAPPPSSDDQRTRRPLDFQRRADTAEVVIPAPVDSRCDRMRARQQGVLPPRSHRRDHVPPHRDRSPAQHLVVIADRIARAELRLGDHQQRPSAADIIHDAFSLIRRQLGRRVNQQHGVRRRQFRLAPLLGHPQFAAEALHHLRQHAEHPRGFTAVAIVHRTLPIQAALRVGEERLAAQIRPAERQRAGRRHGHAQCCQYHGTVRKTDHSGPALTSAAFPARRKPCGRPPRPAPERSQHGHMQHGGQQRKIPRQQRTDRHRPAPRRRRVGMLESRRRRLGQPIHQIQRPRQHAQVA